MSQRCSLLLHTPLRLCFCFLGLSPRCNSREMYFCIAVTDTQVGHWTALLEAWGGAPCIYLALTRAGLVSFGADHFYLRYAGLDYLLCQVVFVLVAILTSQLQETTGQQHRIKRWQQFCKCCVVLLKRKKIKSILIAATGTLQLKNTSQF